MIARRGTAGLFIAFMLASVTCPALASPRSDAQALDKMRAAVLANAEKALARQGGSSILFKVDSAGLREALVTELRDDLYRAVREGRIPFSGLSLRDGGVEIRIAEARDRQRVLARLATPAIGITDSGDGLIRLAPTEAGFAERLRELVTQSSEMIDQRLRDTGIKDAGEQADGADGIRVLLPGVRDPERVSAVLRKRGRVTFRLVDVAVNPQVSSDALPPTSEKLYGYKGREPHVVLKDVAIEGDDLIDATPLIDQRTSEPVVSFRFNGRGARRFAGITQENIGKPFAIVCDDQVLSASVIREPITGGSGQISGIETVQDASDMAMLLRSGSLPGRLTFVEQHLIEPSATAGRQ